jgi:hypothetical protein
MKLFRFIFIWYLFTSLLNAQSSRQQNITLRDGTVLERAIVTDNSPHELIVLSNGEVRQILKTDLSDEMQTKFGYDKVAAEEHVKRLKAKSEQEYEEYKARIRTENTLHAAALIKNQNELVYQQLENEIADFKKRCVETEAREDRMRKAGAELFFRRYIQLNANGKSDISQERIQNFYAEGDKARKELVALKSQLKAAQDKLIKLQASENADKKNKITNPNQAPEPTSVTTPAAQESRQP